MRSLFASFVLLFFITAMAEADIVEEISFNPSHPTAVDGIVVTLSGHGSCPYVDSLTMEGDLITFDLFDLCLSPPAPFTLDVTLDPLPRGLYMVQAAVNGTVCLSRELRVEQAPAVAIPAASPGGYLALVLAVGACAVLWLRAGGRGRGGAPIDSRLTLW